jgi:outer membrane protein
MSRSMALVRGRSARTEGAARRGWRWVLPVAAALTVVPVGVAKAVPPPSGPLTEDEAVRIALAQNYDYRQAEASLNAAAGSRLDAAAGLLPSAGGSYSYSKNKSTRTLKDLETRVLKSTNQVLTRGDVDLTSDSHSTGFGLSLRENLSLPLWYNYRSAQAGVQSARHGLEAAGQTLAFNVRQQFYMVLRAQNLLTVQQEALKLAQDELKRVQSMFELGSVAKVDVLKSQVQVSQARLTLIQQQNQVNIEEARLATLLGFSPDTKLQVSGDLTTQATPVDSTAAARDAMSRPDLLQARQDLRSAQDAFKAAATSRLPSLFASFNVSSSSGASSGDQLTQAEVPNSPAAGDTTLALIKFPVSSQSGSDGWQVQVGASISLDAFLNMGQHKRAHANKRRAEYQLDATRLAAQQELEEAILNYRASIQAIETAQQGLASAQEDLRLSEERYSQGLGTVLELLESQVNLTRARNDLVNAQTGLKISEAAVDKARGAPLPR